MDLKKKKESSERGYNQPDFSSLSRVEAALVVVRDHAMKFQEKEDLSYQFNKESVPSITHRNGISHESEKGLMAHQISVSDLSENRISRFLSNRQQESTMRQTLVYKPISTLIFILIYNSSAKRILKIWRVIERAKGSL